MSAPPQDNPDKRPLPSGWVSQYNPDYRTWYYINTTAHPPLSTWVHPLDSPSQAPPTSQYAAPPGSPPPPNYSSRPAPTQSYNQGQGYGYDGGPSGYNNQPAGYGGPPGGGPGGYNRPAVGYGQPQGEYRGGNYGQAQYDKYYQEGGYQRPPSPERGGSYGRMFTEPGRGPSDYRPAPDVVYQQQPPKKQGLSSGAKLGLGLTLLS
ncbi:hypothetical protein AX15_003369 [Amanita polypyramis BW_CC]|nr:hypothetical protein AX15_003369 [Amanita polypyramis BW_CC]